MSLARLVGEKNAEPPRLMIRVDPSPGCLAWHHLDETFGIYLLMFVYVCLYSHISFHMILVFQSVIKGYQEHQHQSTSTSHLAKYLSQL